jgi:uncharacterized PurR-regulated membrane protein YhhQ (DUF165 family)
MIWVVPHVATIVAANWAIAAFGVVPVGFGLRAPTGVYFAELAITFRNLTQEKLGRRAVVVAILFGAALSALISPQFALASGVAFLFSELADFGVYTPLRKRFWLWAMITSNLVGTVLDSVIFLGLAFGSLEFLVGQVVGKTWVTLLTVPFFWAFRRRLIGREGA